MAGSIYYDADCDVCTAAVRRFERLLSRHQFDLVALQTPDAGERLGVQDDRLLDEIRLRLSNGNVYGGAAAIMEIARRIWWAWPMWAFSRLPGVLMAMDAVYRWFARRRHCAIRR
jgi:predicted DCC family thiol-disulfide oxidoreductase YuxK